MRRWLAGIPGIAIAGLVVNYLPNLTPSPRMTIEVTTLGTPVSPGGTAVIQAQVLSSPANPIALADVEIEIGGGTFKTSGKRSVEGKTNITGFFSDAWTSPQSCGGTYLVAIRSQKAGFGEAAKQIRLSIEC